MPAPDFRILGAPRQYIQGPGAIGMLADIARQHDATPLILIDSDVRSVLGKEWMEGFHIEPTILECSGEVTIRAIQNIARAAGPALESQSQPVLVFGIGGGKALDTAKGVARRLNCGFVAVPTIASNDSPIGRAIAIYDVAHKLASIEQLQRNPEAVVVDTALIAQAPARFLRAGIGDAISKKFEAERAYRDGSKNFFGARATLSALTLAHQSYVTLREFAEEALTSVEVHRTCPALEATVEACILMSGIAWESGGVSLAHAAVRGIARLPGADASLHGEQVAYGLLVQMAIEGACQEDIADLLRFYASTLLPTRLRALGVDVSSEEAAHAIGQWAHEGPSGGNLHVSASKEDISAAVLHVEQLSQV